MKRGLLAPQRGLRAPLSPNEEKELRRVANGISTPTHMGEASVERLKRLALVEELEGRIHLTALGALRFAGDRTAGAAS